MEEGLGEPLGEGLFVEIEEGEPFGEGSFVAPGTARLGPGLETGVSIVSEAGEVSGRVDGATEDEEEEEEAEGAVKEETDEDLWSEIASGDPWLVGEESESGSDGPSDGPENDSTRRTLKGPTLRWVDGIRRGMEERTRAGQGLRRPKEEWSHWTDLRWPGEEIPEVIGLAEALSERYWWDGFLETTGRLCDRAGVGLLILVPGLGLTQRTGAEAEIRAEAGTEASGRLRRIYIREEFWYASCRNSVVCVDTGGGEEKGCAWIFPKAYGKDAGRIACGRMEPRLQSFGGIGWGRDGLRTRDARSRDRRRDAKARREGAKSSTTQLRSARDDLRCRDSSLTGG